jgi:hypothetical protein
VHPAPNQQHTHTQVYTITVEGDGVTVKDKFGQMFSARVNSSAIVEADLENSVAGASSMSVGGMNFAISPEQVTGRAARLTRPPYCTGTLKYYLVPPFLSVLN